MKEDMDSNSMEKLFTNSREFNQLFPPSIQQLAHRHWTPLHIAKKAAAFLSTGTGAKVLDIGSGVGNFCLPAAYYHPEALFYGIEQRESLVAYAEAAKQKLHINNAFFIQGNLLEISLEEYDHFYFYNSFYENLTIENEKIDDALTYSKELYFRYNRFLYTQLNQKPSGTRMVTYYSSGEEMPPSYYIVYADMNEMLRFYVKE